MTSSLEPVVRSDEELALVYQSDDREAFDELYKQGMNYTEIGEVLEISENAVKHRAFQPPSDLRTRVLEAIQEHETRHGK